MATATLLPMARAVFYDANGNPLAGGKVSTFIPATTTPNLTWQDAAETIPNSNPITLDSAGSWAIYGSGAYQITVTDALGVAVPGYSGLTLDTLSALTTEITRATAAEVTNTTAITAETTRALAAEGANTAAIALRALLSSFTNSLVGNGYQKLPGGYIRQWGSSATGGGGGVAISYPIVFPSAVLNVQISVLNTGLAPTILDAISGTPTASTFGVNTGNTAGAFVGGVTFYWEAIGS
jgi:hypothetical protein